MRRVVLVVHVATARIERLRQRVESDEPSPHVGGSARRDRHRVTARRRGQARDGAHPDGEDVASPIGVGEVRRGARAGGQRALPLGETARPHHGEKLRPGAILTIWAGAHDVQLVGGAIHDWAEGREGHAPCFAHERVVGAPDAVGERDGLISDRDGGAIEPIAIRSGGIEIELVDLVEIGGVVGGCPAQVFVETADDRECATDAEVAVEIQRAGQRDVGFPVSGGPREVRIT